MTTPSNSYHEITASLRLIIEENPDGILVIDPQGSVSFANRAATELFQRDLMACEFGFPLQSHQPAELDILLPSGETRIVEMRVVNIAWHNDTACLATLRDITERKHLENALRESEARFRAILEAVVEGMLVVNPEGLIIMVNPQIATLFGYSPDELIHQPIEKLIPEVAHAQHIVNRQAYVKNPSNRPMGIGLEILGRKRTGETFPAEVSLSVIPTEDSFWIMALITDITKRKEAEQQSFEIALEREKVRILQQFIMDVSHDFKTPLAALSTGLYLLDRHVMDADGHQRVERLAQQITRLNTILNNMLDLVELEKQDYLKITRVDLYKVVKEFEASIEPKVQEKQLKLLVSVPENLPRLQADEDLLYRLLSNLVSNAIQYTPPQGQIHLSVVGNTQTVTVRVQDTGIGIEEKHQPYIFDRFYRTDSARNSYSGGSGLGLAIVKKIVDLHKGEIKVKSALNQGTTFEVILPQT